MFEIEIKLIKKNFPITLPQYNKRRVCTIEEKTNEVQKIKGGEKCWEV